MGLIVIYFIKKILYNLWYDLNAQFGRPGMLDMSNAAIADLEITDFGICQAVMVFGEDDHAVGAYNSKVGNLVGTLCLLCRFNPADANRWAEAASLHDLGKLWIPSDILLKQQF